MNASTIRVLALMDWFLLILANFPVQFAKPFVLALQGKPQDAIVDAFVFSLLTFPILLLVCAALASFVDRARGAQAPPTEPLEESWRQDLLKLARKEGIGLSASTIGRCRIVGGDLSMGAHVRGVFRRYIVLSGGLMVGLLQGNAKAIAILRHEAAHLRHGDQVLLLFMGLVALQVGYEIMVQPAYIVLHLFYAALVFGIPTSIISRYREYYADAHALASGVPPATYVDLLSTAGGREAEGWAFFHPSMARRKKEVESGFKTVRRAIFWKVYWPLFFLTSWIVWWQMRLADADPIDEEYLAYAMPAALFAIVVVYVARPWIVRRGMQAAVPYREGSG